MLDVFLSVAYEQEKKAESYQEAVQLLQQLPQEELYALAEGAKLASDGSDEWLEKFEGTPLAEKALQLEQAYLEAEIANEKKSLERRLKPEPQNDDYHRQDVIRLQKRILDLELTKHRVQSGEFSKDEEEPKEASIPGVTEEQIASMRKQALGGLGMLGALGKMGLRGARKGMAAVPARAGALGVLDKTKGALQGAGGMVTRGIQGAAKTHPGALAQAAGIGAAGIGAAGLGAGYMAGRQ